MFGPQHFKKLEILGLGLGLNDADMKPDYLDGYGSLIDYFELGYTDYALLRPMAYHERAPCREGRAPSGLEQYALRGYKTVMHASTVNPMYADGRSEASTEALVKVARSCATPWVTEDLGVWAMRERHVYPNFLPVSLTREALNITAQNVNGFQEAAQVPFAAENPSVSVLIGQLHLFDFLAELVDRTGCAVALDIGHLLSYQLARGESPTADLHRLPWPSVVELHVSGGSIDLGRGGYVYRDLHGDYEPVSICWDLLRSALDLAPNLKAVTLEIFGAKSAGKTMRRVAKLRRELQSGGWPVRRPKVLSTGEQPNDRATVTRLTIDMYDALHDPGSPMVASCGATTLLTQLVAQSVIERWEDEKSLRIAALCSDIVGYMPLTAAWLIQEVFAADEEAFNRELVRQLPRDDSPIAQSFVVVMERLVSATDNHIGRGLLELEVWLNSLPDIELPSIREFNFDPFAVLTEANAMLALKGRDSGRFRVIAVDPHRVFIQDSACADEKVKELSLSR